MSDRPPGIAVIGGGISGLVAAHRVLELDRSANVSLLEGGSRLGGVLQTEHRDGYLIEHGADNFITTMPWGVEFCERIGFATELVPTNTAYRRAFVVRKGKLRPIPSGFAIMAPSRVWPVLSTPILSPLGKLRLISELLVPRRRDDSDESLASFVTRRLGRETYERLVQPLVAGIYTADPEKLSVDATMPRFPEMERRHGSLIRAMWKQNGTSKTNGKGAGGARYSQFVAPREGMSALVAAVGDQLPRTAIQLNSCVERLTPQPEGRWRIEFRHRREPVEVDGIVLAVPSHHCARLLREVDNELANDLARIEYGSCALATFGFERRQIRHSLDGFGVVVPLVERRRILSASFSSVKYPGRAPDGHVLIRAFFGGACQPEVLDENDDGLLDIARRELADLLHIDGAPQLVHINRQVNAMPQFHVGHQTLIQKITARVDKLAGISLAGNSLHGVGIPHCIRTAEAAAEQVMNECALPTVAPM